ncbi:MAG: DsbA family protein [Mangrovicoccus sp.]|nr:DsbA family protein [Mangrovicoccus sp.]
MFRTLSRPLAALGLGAALSLSAAHAQDLTALDDAGRTALREEIRSYLLENPEVLVEAMDVLRARDAQAQANAEQQLLSELQGEIFEDGRSWQGGNPEGDIILVEFTDYRCGYCRKAHDEVAELIEMDGGIKFIVKEFPILGEASLLSSRFAIAVRLEAGDDAYKAAHDALITLRGEPSDENLRGIADKLSLDADAVMARMDDPAVMEELRANRLLAEQLSIQGTPTFILQDELIRGYVPLAGMMQKVMEKREES